MSANVETLMYVSNEENGRFVPWHGLGTAVENAPTSAEAIELAGLNWKVNPQPVYTDFPTGGKIEIPNAKANVRDSDGKVLGIVTDRYQIVQNIDAFDFTDSLIGEGCTYETAGALDGGKKVFLLAKMPQKRILEEEFDPYICFTNTFDGSGSIKAVMTPVRVVCQNTLSLALNGATRKWSTRHVGRLDLKLEEARHTLQLANKYMDKLADTADILANTTITEDEAMKVLDKLFPVSSEASDRQKANMAEKKEQFMICMFAPDILKYKGTAYQMVQAASDFATHTAPQRMTTTYQERNFNKVLDGHPIIDTTFLEMLALAKKGS